MARVELDKVTKRFGDVVAVDDVSMTIEDGELLVLVGPSGCGKTTTLRMIAGLEYPTDGRVFIGPKDVTEIAPGNRDIAMVFQDLALYPHLNVRENMSFGLRMRGFPDNEIAARVEEAAEMLQIPELIDRQINELSGGQQQRVALGRALVRDPSVFLLDEPLGALDAKLRREMRSEIIELHETIDATMVYVTHDQEIAMTLGDRIAVMHEGKIQQLDEPSTVYRTPQNLFVAQFIGSPDMNVFNATTSVDGDSLRVQSDVFDFSLSTDGRSVEGLDGRDILAGIRPQDIHHADYVAENLASNPEFSIEVDIVEEMGSASDVHFTRAGTTFIARFNVSADIDIGGTVPILLDVENLHLFDATTGERIAGVDREIVEAA